MNLLSMIFLSSALLISCLNGVRTAAALSACLDELVEVWTQEYVLRRQGELEALNANLGAAELWLSRQQPVHRAAIQFSAAALRSKTDVLLNGHSRVEPADVKWPIPIAIQSYRQVNSGVPDVWPNWFYRFVSRK